MSSSSVCTDPPGRDDDAGAAPLELEHVIGYSGRHKHTLVASPLGDAVYLSGIGANVVIGDITDPHKQSFLKGHTGDISALAVNFNGSLIASGQVASVLSPVRHALSLRRDGVGALWCSAAVAGVVVVVAHNDREFVMGIARLVFVRDCLVSSKYRRVGLKDTLH